MTDYPVSSGQTVTGLQLAGGDTQTVSSGGSIISTNASGPFNNYDPTDYSKLQYPGTPLHFYAGVGGEVVLRGGASTGTTLNEGTESIYQGGVSNSTTVGSVILEGDLGGYQVVLAGSQENIYAGGTADNTLVQNGNQSVMDGGISNNASVAGATNYGYHGYSIAPGATQTVMSGGTANGTNLNGGSSTIAAGGTATATIINYLGIQSVSGAAANTVINVGGTEFVAQGGTASNTTVNGAAPFTYAPIPYYYFATTSVAGGLNVQAGGAATNTLVEAGGKLDDFGDASATSLIGSKTLLTVEAGANAEFTDIGNGSLELVLGTDTEVHVEQAGELSIMAGGKVLGTLVDAGAQLFVAPEGTLTTAMFEAINDDGAIFNSGSIVLPSVIGGGGNGIGIGPQGVLSNSGSIVIGGGFHPIIGATTNPGGIDIAAGGSLVNTGSISVGGGSSQVSFVPAPTGSITVDVGASLTNAGTLNIDGRVSVAGTLVLDAGQVTTGMVQGTATGTLELAASASGTLSGLGSVYTGFETVQLDAGASWTVQGGVLALGATLELGAGSSLTLSGSLGAPSGGTINFQGASTLALSLQSQTNAGISGFGIASVIQAAGSQTGNTVFALASNDTTINLADGYSPYILRFLGEAGRHLQLRQNQSLMGTLTLEPVATAITAHPDMPGTLAAGSVITFDLTPEAALSVNTTTGLPTLALSNGGVATYDQTASTSTNLVFRTTVGGAQSSSDLTVTGLSLGGSSVVDALGTTFDVSSVATLSGSNTGIIISGPATTTPTPPTTVTGGVTVIGGAGGTVFITPKAGSSSVTATATGNDTIISQGSDTIQAGGGADVVYATGAAATVAGGTGSLTFEGATGNDLVIGGSGSNAIYGGTGSDTFFGGTGFSILVAGSGANTLLLAGVGNATLLGGLGKAVVMFGGPGTDSFTGSSGGGDIMVGGAGGNSFSLTGGDVAFGSPIKADSFTAGNGAATIITGGGGAQVNLGSGTLTSFEGSGAVNYNAGKGEGGTTDIVGFTVHDHITLTGGFTAQDASTAFSTATKGSFGTTLNLTDGTKITVFGISLTATQVSVS